MKVVYDTCVYIDFLRTSKNSELFYDRSSFRFLSPIVAMELRAGAQGTAEIKALDRLFLPYSNAQRVITLSANTFLKAGEIIQKVHKSYGALSQGFSHDVLIALSAATIGATLFTSNRKDFDKIASYLSFKHQFL